MCHVDRVDLLISWVSDSIRHLQKEIGLRPRADWPGTWNTKVHKESYNGKLPYCEQDCARHYIVLGIQVLKTLQNHRRSNQHIVQDTCYDPLLRLDFLVVPCYKHNITTQKSSNQEDSTTVLIQSLRSTVKLPMAPSSSLTNTIFTIDLHVFTW